MHEFRQAGILIKKIEELLSDKPGSHLESIQVKISPLNDLTPGHLRQHFEKAAHGTVAEGAKLQVHISDDYEFPHGQDIYLESVTLKE
ncbi:MAG: hydrogenase maturation nickel metallochaperone HypA [Candidatus Omnitrophica bacterium]|nr:hydrogenase maturation nickel metallochaperone HypA [Candidatus Omnitrophota bacterium]MCA9439984.1 hydrogenase maturation nickel metallochaperone HypA [Candidatus Omnitrophota bacterium]MCA9448252.1 hydrogenase maturation nickel metallochaperone HypA [Candidatus Omnitrophota bacterium]